MSGGAHEVQLVSRAYTFINESLRNTARSEREGSDVWIFAISNVAQGLELLLKERLKREHPVLIYADLERSRTTTVSFGQALARLKRCGVDLPGDDLQRLNRARDLRNALVHYAPDVTEGQLRAAYVDLFEFAHVFHLEQLGDELHPHIDPALWSAETQLMEEFRAQFVQFQGSTVDRTWPSALIDAQLWPYISIGDDAFARIRYGEERGWTEERPPTTCHDCAALPGQLHGDGCDMEQCPSCGGQFLSCDCEAVWATEPE